MLIYKLSLGLSTILLSLFLSWNEGYKKGNERFTARKSKKLLASEKAFQDPGKEIYTDFCIQCHGANGKGDGVNFPPLDGSDWLIAKRKQSIHSVKYGQSGAILVNNKKFNNTMPPMGLSNKEVAQVMNYIMNSWSNKEKRKVTEKEVDEVKK